jgi:predicted transposase YbfD/YdcC
VADQDQDTLAALGAGRTEGPSESAIRRLLTRMDADRLDAVIGAWMWTRTGFAGGRRVIALDGKTVRGARRRGRAQDVAPHLVAAFDHTEQAVLGQVAVAAKSNEIPAVRTLLGSFDLNEAVITLDAMHTQTDTARAITGAGGEYVLTVKNNQPRLYAALKKLPWADIPGHTAVDTGHGRRARRTIKVTAAPAWVTFADAAQVAQIRRTTTRDGAKSVEVVYVITSADHQSAPPVTLAGWVQGHWASRTSCTTSAT